MIQLIEKACNAIGAGDPKSDWKITPTAHANSLPPEASSLADVLISSRPKGLAEQYEEWNERAGRARDEFKKTVARANWAVFSAATLAALLLIVGALQDELGTTARWIFGAFSCLGVTTGGLGVMWLSEVRQGSLSRKWSKERAGAEAKRLEYFKSVMEESAADPLSKLLAFEYTRRYLLDNQIDYFRGRGLQHEQAADTARRISTRAVFVSSTLTTIAGLLAMSEPRLATVAGIGVIATGYSALAVSRSTLNQDQRNMDRYRLSRTHLENRALYLDSYRQKLAAGDFAALEEFYEPIFDTLAADHRSFLDDAKKRDIAIGELRKRLDSALESVAPNRADDALPPPR